MTKDNDIKEQAFLLQFGGNGQDVSRNVFHLNNFEDPVTDMKYTGLFGILDALVDLKLTNKEIKNFYINNHVESYNDPYEFTKGIIEIVFGLSNTEIKNKYGNFFNDERIAKISIPNKNTKMLISFCYYENDQYLYISNKEDLYIRFINKFESESCYLKTANKEKDLKLIDGKLYRAIHFLVRQGYDFPKLDSLFDNLIKNIVFKQNNSENTFILNKDFAYEMSDILLSLVHFLKINNYQILNSVYLFDKNCDNIIVLDPNGNQIVFNRHYLDSNIIKYDNLLKYLKSENFDIPDIISLCDKRVKNINLKYYDNYNKEHNLIIKRDLLFSISNEWLKIIEKSYNLGFSFSDFINLFDMNNKLLKVSSSNGKEYFTLRKYFANILEIINQYQKYDFSLNLNQLFDINKNTIDICDKHGNKNCINRDRLIFMISVINLLMQNDYFFKDYSNLFDEKNPYIICYDINNVKKILSRKQIYKCIKLLKLSDQDIEKLTDREKDLLMMLNNSHMRINLFEWLPYTAKKWIPSSAVINKIPKEQSYEYFYNNNHKRLKILKDAYHANSYEEMDGIISIGYILGLFDNKERTSEKAMNFIIDYFLNKGITANKLHTIYGAIDLKKGYNKQFADFFMKHYAIDSQAFVEPDLGINMTGELFERFTEILENRSEKKIKTRTKNKLLTPTDAMASIINLQISKEIYGDKINDERYLHLIRLLLKYGASIDEVKWSMNLYEKALAIDEAEVKIPNIEDSEDNLMQYISHLKSDPQVFLSGRKTNCCSRYGGFAQDRLIHVITDINWRYVTFTSPNKTFFDGLVWYDQEEKTVCIDNVEGQFNKNEKANPKAVALMADSVIRYADGIYYKMNKLNIPCRKVNVGKDPGTASWEIFNYAKGQKLIMDDCNPCDYPTRNGISSDAKKQFTITDANILKLRKKITK